MAAGRFDEEVAFFAVQLVESSGAVPVGGAADVGLFESGGQGAVGGSVAVVVVIDRAAAGAEEGDRKEEENAEWFHEDISVQIRGRRNLEGEESEVKG